jgi:DNA-binding IclR family transcriptional regulator
VELADFVHKNGLDNFTPNTITDMDDFKREMETVREMQLAWEREEHIQNLNGVAAAIRDAHGKMIAAVCINGFTNNVSVAELEQMTGMLLDVTYNISEALSYTGGQEVYL